MGRSKIIILNFSLALGILDLDISSDNLHMQPFFPLEDLLIYLYAYTGFPKNMEIL